jgi:SulP family sulfate permease
MITELQAKVDLGRSLKPIPDFLARPARLIASYDRENARPDIVAGLTVAVILLPQAIAYSLVAELPPVMGLYTAIIGAFVGSLWGSSNQAHTGPTNTISLLVLATLIPSFIPGTADYILAAGLLAIMAGVFQFVLGLARLGMLVNFVSHSVIVGFAAGAGVLIAVRQMPPLLGLQVSAHSLAGTLADIATELSEVNVPTAVLGIGSIVVIVVLRKINPRIPGALISMVVASLLVFLFNLEEAGVAVIGELPKGLPPLISFSQIDLAFIRQLSTGALAVAAIGLVETTAISRSIATRTGQRLDSNQEFVGQGMANIAAGLFSGYPCAGSFTRSAVNYNAGSRSPMAAVSSGVFILILMLALAPMAAYLPRSALAGVLIVVSIGMINRKEMARIWRGTRGDAIIMLVTFLATLFSELAFAILFGILLSFALYIVRTSTPRVRQVVPDEKFNHFVHAPQRPTCPQLGVIDIMGDLYFGAVKHVEEAMFQHIKEHPDQRYLLVRMHNVNHCDFSGIHMLENVVHTFRERGGDVFMVRVDSRVDRVMSTTGFTDVLGSQHFLSSDRAIDYLFHHVLDPAFCIYECPFRVFRECQNLPKQLFMAEIPELDDDVVLEEVGQISARTLWEEIRLGEEELMIVDVREPREYLHGHIPEARLIPLPHILSGDHQFEPDGGPRLILVCRSGRRSRRAAQIIMSAGCKAEILQGGMLAWEAAGLLEAIE